MKPARPKQIRTTISLDAWLMVAGRSKAAENGQSLSSYLGTLVRRDLRKGTK